MCVCVCVGTGVRVRWKIEFYIILLTAQLLYNQGMSLILSVRQTDKEINFWLECNCWLDWLLTFKTKKDIIFWNQMFYVTEELNLVIKWRYLLLFTQQMFLYLLYFTLLLNFHLNNYSLYFASLLMDVINIVYCLFCIWVVLNVFKCIINFICFKCQFN